MDVAAADAARGGFTQEGQLGTHMLHMSCYMNVHMYVLSLKQVNMLGLRIPILTNVFS